MVKDINSGSSSSNPNYLTAVGNTLYFQADDGTNGSELWKSDGTASGTVMVKDIHSGSSTVLPPTSQPLATPLFPSHRRNQRRRIVEERWNGLRHGDGQRYPEWKWQQFSLLLTAVGNTLYFVADEGTNGHELWKSDGTASGTVMVKDIYSGSYSGQPSDITGIGNTLYFKAYDGLSGFELWKSDGTTSGTVMVKDIRSGSSSSSPSQLTAVGNTLYFAANDGTNGAELWKSDGTASGTVMVKDINPGSSNGDIYYLTAVGYNFYFRAYNPSTGYELYGTQTVSTVYYA